MRTIAQIPAQVKYLLVVLGPDTGSNIDLMNPTAADCYAFSCNEGTFSGSHLSSQTANTELSAPGTNAAGIDLEQGTLYKDLGRQIVIYDPDTHLRLAIFREVQEVDGPLSEGVPDNYPTARFIKVWSASGAGVYVARQGPGA